MTQHATGRPDARVDQLPPGRPAAAGAAQADVRRRRRTGSASASRCCSTRGSASAGWTPSASTSRSGSRSSTSWASRCWSPPTSPARCTRPTTSAATAARSWCPSTGDAPPAPCDARSLRCPYHSWTYDLAGRLLKAPHTEGLSDFDPAEFGLAPVGVGSLGRLRLLPPHARAGAGPGRRDGAVRGPAGALPAGVAGERAPLRLRRARQLQGPAGELQRVLPLRAGAPRADPAGAVVRRRWHRPRLGQRRGAPRRCLDVHHHRHHQPPAVPRPRRARARAAQGRAGLPEPVRRPARPTTWPRSCCARSASTAPGSSATCCSHPTRSGARASTPTTPATCGTWSTVRTGRSASRCSAA